jgi:predicted GNAT family acetyltransferase
VASPTVDLGFQQHEQAFASLPGGCVLLAWHGEAVVGCAALRRIDASTAEMKRVYLRPAARNQGLGRRLNERVLTEARRLGYRRVCLDMLPEFTAAQSLYRSLGFEPAAPVSSTPCRAPSFWPWRSEPVDAAPHQSGQKTPRQQPGRATNRKAARERLFCGAGRNQRKRDCGLVASSVSTEARYFAMARISAGVYCLAIPAMMPLERPTMLLPSTV